MGEPEGCRGDVRPGVVVRLHVPARAVEAHAGQPGTVPIPLGGHGLRGARALYVCRVLVEKLLL